MENEFDSAQLSRIYVNRGQYSKERRYAECYVVNKKNMLELMLILVMQLRLVNRLEDLDS